jgi:hypothetical protein
MKLFKLLKKFVNDYWGTDSIFTPEYMYASKMEREANVEFAVIADRMAEVPK